MFQWYVVHCRSTREKQAAATLQNTCGLSVYIPEIRRRAQDDECYPLFPCYVFARINLHILTRETIRRMPGIINLVSFDGEPQAIPATLIEEMAERIEIINERGGVLDHRFAIGDPVRLKRGPLRGLDGIFQGPVEPSERVRILIDFMGNLNRVEVEADMLERASGTPQPEPKRRTRGKGRRINNVHSSF